MGDITRHKNLNPPRRDRTYPRVIKHARHNSYRVKSPVTTAHTMTGRPRSSWSTSIRSPSPHDR
jgi:hypothetical protein